MMKTNIHIKTVILALVLTGFLFSVSLSTPAWADKLPTAETLWDKVTQINPKLQDYEVAMKILVKAKYKFLNPTLNLKGTYYYKKPDKHKLILDKASYFLKQYPKVFGWSLPKLKEFNSKVELAKLNGRDCYLVTLTPKTIAGDVERERIWIDKENYTFPQHIYEYKNQGQIMLNVVYRKEDKFIVFSKMNASFKIPKENLTATAVADYGQYKFNTGIKDSFFEDGK